MRKFLALSTLLLAATFACASSSVDYDTGSFLTGKLTGTFSTNINIGIQGSLDTIDLQTGSLTLLTAGCTPGATCYSFGGGLVKVLSGGGQIFFDNLSGGILIRTGNAVSIIATLMSEPGVISGSAVASFTFSGLKVTSGSENVSLNQTSAVPEVGTLMLFGSGLVGMVGVARRRILAC